MFGRMSRLLAGVAFALGMSRTANAEAPTDRDRAITATSVVTGGALYVVLEKPFKETITPAECRWCRTNAFDRGVRDALVWSPANVRTANTISNLTGFVGSPVFALGTLMASTAGDPSAGRWFDDTLPVLQAVVATGLVNQLFKVTFGRRRPYAELGGVPIRPANDVNTSFFSGHTALGFTLATSSAMVAHLRGYRSEAALWIGGGALAATTGYLRIAADAHYASDVLVGALVGGAIGVAVPLLLHRDVLEEDAPGATPRLGGDQPVVFSFGGSF